MMRGFNSFFNKLNGFVYLEMDKRMKTNKISIAIEGFGEDASRVFDCTPDSVMGADRGERRLVGQATLDGGSLFYDTGYSATDRDVRFVSASGGDSLLNWFRALVMYHDTVTLSTHEGMFRAIPSRWEMVNGRPAITLRIKEQITQG